MLWLALALSLVGLAVGPLLVYAGGGKALPSAALEGFTLGVVPVLILSRLVPHVVEGVGYGALALVAAGYFTLWFADRYQHDGGDKLGSAVVVPALVVHALSDGAGLAMATAATHGHHDGVGAGLGVALVLHRLPEGLFLTTALIPRLGWRRTLTRLGGIAAATIVGALLGKALMESIPDAFFDAVVAFGLGAMLRLAVHNHHPLPTTSVERRVSGLAFLAGVTLAVAIPDPDSVLTHAQPRELPLIESLGPLFIETAPSMLLGLLVAGAAQTFLPRQVAAWLGSPSSSLGQAARGMVFGVPLPLCSCGVLPLGRRLLAAGVPVAAVTGFLVGTPELDLGAMILSWRMLGWPFVLARVLGGVALALLAGVVVARVTRGVKMRTSLRPAPPGAWVRTSGRWQATPHETSPARPRALDRAVDALAQAMGPTLDHVAAWYVVGLLASAAFEAAVDSSVLARLGAPYDVVAGALAAVPVYVCAQGATPFAAMMVHKGMSPGAALAFLLVGPATNLAVLGVLRRALGNRAAVSFALTTLVGAVLVGALVNAVVATRTVPEMHGLVAHAHHGYELACAALLGALLVRSLLRVGPRQWFGAMSPGEDDGHDHTKG